MITWLKLAIDLENTPFKDGYSRGGIFITYFNFVEDAFLKQYKNNILYGITLQ